MGSSKLDEDLAGAAVIGMMGRFPGATDLDDFWENLVLGRDSISHFSESELEPSRLEPRGCRGQPNYVRARGVLADVDRFDAAFFGVSPREAEVMDPQHRLFLQGVWSALESAGYDPASFKGSIGVWAGMSRSSYFLENILARRDVAEQVGTFQAMLGNDRDYLATRASYKLNLRGPSVNVQTACSTSLVAVCHAFQALVDYQCDMAVAGGVSIVFPQRCGYLYQRGGILSRDGCCRPFDADATGTVFSNGLGVVVLKRLEDALADGDCIHAVVRGAALNNDGSDKVSFSAPSVNGQANVILMAQEIAGVEPDTISYVEAHGTGTLLGDPVEVAGLTQAFRCRTEARQFCALGSVKGNIGHLDAAAGVAGLVKTVLSLRHRTLVPSLHFTRANPQIDFESSPFYVNTTSRPWPEGRTRRRAGVSSFGVGGTNAHVILEEAPVAAPPSPTAREQLVLLSAKSEPLLDRACMRLSHRLRSSSELSLADVAYTLQVGRRAFSCRRALVCGEAAEAVDLLENGPAPRSRGGSRSEPGGERDRLATEVAFLFPGQGAQYAGMAAGLYQSEPDFATEFDACARVLNPLLGLDIRDLAFAAPPKRAEAEQRLSETGITQPVLFAVEIALARLWMAWGIEPAAMIGHSLGEYVAACLAGVLSTEQAAVVVAARGRLAQAQPPGAMLAVRLSLAALRPWLESDVVVAGLNAPELNVVSGPRAAVRALESRLAEQGIGCRRLATSHAFHSPLMDGALAELRQLLRDTPLQRPKRPWISGVTGDWVTAEQATDPEYWVQQMRQPVRFSDGIRRLSQDPALSFLEVGPGHALASLVRSHPHRPPQQAVVVSMERDSVSDRRSMLQALGALWVAGAAPNWRALHAKESRRRVDLPTYPFQGERHWIEPTSDKAPSAEHLPAQAAQPPPEPPQAQLTSAHGNATDASETSVLERLRTLFSNSSGHPPESIGVSQPFLELGFDSLLLTQVGAAIQRTFSVEVSLRQFLEQLNTLELLARHVKADLSRASASPSTPSNDGVEPPAPHEADPEPPPVPGARLGRDAQGKSCWFVPDPNRPGKYLYVRAHDKI